MVKKLRILHAPTDVGGQAWGLTQAEKQLGYNSVNLIYRSHTYGYHYDINLHFERRNLFTKAVLLVYHFLISLFSYDVFHFYSGVSFFPGNLDLPILRLFGKKVFFTFQGCDIRLHHAVFSSGGKEYTFTHTCNCNKIVDQKKLRKVNFITKFSHATFALNPDLLLSSPSSILLPYANVNATEWQQTPPIPKKPHDSFLIVHAPTDREVKGTKYIIETIRRLQQDGYPVRLKLIENLIHSKMEEACSDADIVIDQLLIGWYGGFAVEMMALAKPVLCYIDQRLSPLVPFFNSMPILNVTPSSLFTTLKDLVSNPERLQQISKKSVQFVETVHNPKKIATLTTHFYQNAYR